MINITITEKESAQENLTYLHSSAGDLLNRVGCTVRIIKIGGRIVFSVNCPECYADIIRSEIADKVAEIIAIKYKYDYFKSMILVGGLKSVEKEILYASLIAADLEDDKKYAFDRIKNSKVLAIDGVFNFCLKPLKKKWQDVADCIPQCFLREQLREFITYLLENKRKRVYIDKGVVYDNHYRMLKRSSLLDGENVKIVREVLLSNCGEIELDGNLPKEDEAYLKEYYKDKIFFTPHVN